MPETRPTTSESIGETIAAQALEATRPASHPFAQRLASGLPKRIRVTAKVATNAAAAERSVFTAVTGRELGIALSHRSAPAMFHASQPASASRQPKST